MQTSYDRQGENLEGAWDGDDNHFRPGLTGTHQFEFGVFVANDFSTGAQAVRPLATGMEEFDVAGVTARTGHDPQGNTGNNQIPAGAVATILDRGVIRVPTVGAVTPTNTQDGVYIVVDPDTGQRRGSIRATADGARTVRVRKGIKVREGATDGIATIQIDVLNFLPDPVLDS